MVELSDSNIALLQRFADADNHTLSSEDLRRVYSGTLPLDRVKTLIDAGFICVARSISYGLGDDIIVLGHPVAWTITPAGIDFLSDWHKSENERRKADAEQQSDKKRDRLRSWTIAIVAAIVGAIVGAVFGRLLR